MSATAINQVRIYSAAVPEDQVRQRADQVVRLLALGLVRSLGKRRSADIGPEPGRAVGQRPATDSLTKEIR